MEKKIEEDGYICRNCRTLFVRWQERCTVCGEPLRQKKEYHLGDSIVTKMKGKMEYGKEEIE